MDPWFPKEILRMTIQTCHEEDPMYNAFDLPKANENYQATVVMKSGPKAATMEFQLKKTVQETQESKTAQKTQTSKVAE